MYIARYMYIHGSIIPNMTAPYYYTHKGRNGEWIDVNNALEYGFGFGNLKLGKPLAQGLLPKVPRQQSTTLNMHMHHRMLLYNLCMHIVTQKQMDITYTCTRST